MCSLKFPERRLQQSKLKNYWCSDQDPSYPKVHIYMSCKCSEARLNLLRFWIEAKQLLTLSFPVILSQWLRFFNIFISIAICGNLGRTEFAAVTLGTTVVNVLGLCLISGFATSFDTIFAQTYGSKNRHVLGILLQQAICATVVLYLVLALILLNIEPILVVLGQNKFVSHSAAIYVSYLIPGIGCDFIFVVIARYLQAQNVVVPTMVVSAVGTLLNVCLQYYFVSVSGYGSVASSICLSFTFACVLVCLCCYVIFSRIYQHTWTKFSLLGALSNWGLYFRFGFPGMLMVSLEEWCFEVSTFIAGNFGEVMLGGMSIAFELQTMMCAIPVGLSAAVNVRIAQSLGGGQPKRAQHTYFCSIVIMLIMTLVTAIALLLAYNKIPALFTKDKEIQSVALSLMPMLAVFQVLEGMAGVSEAVLLACGRQTIGAGSIFLGYYCIGLPIAFLLAYKTSLQIRGAWIGLAVGFGSAAVAFTVLAVRTDWEHEAVKAQQNKLGNLRDQSSENPHAIVCLKSLKWRDKDTRHKQTDDHSENPTNQECVLISEPIEIPPIKDMQLDRFNRRLIRRRLVLLVCLGVLYFATYASRRFHVTHTRIEKYQHNATELNNTSPEVLDISTPLLLLSNSSL